jgi:hypothetical protein
MVAYGPRRKGAMPAEKYFIELLLTSFSVTDALISIFSGETHTRCWPFGKSGLN